MRRLVLLSLVAGLSSAACSVSTSSNSPAANGASGPSCTAVVSSELLHVTTTGPGYALSAYPAPGGDPVVALWFTGSVGGYQSGLSVAAFSPDNNKTTSESLHVFGPTSDLVATQLSSGVALASSETSSAELFITDLQSQITYQPVQANADSVAGVQVQAKKPVPIASKNGVFVIWLDKRPPADAQAAAPIAGLYGHLMSADDQRTSADDVQFMQDGATEISGGPEAYAGAETPNGILVAWIAQGQDGHQHLYGNVGPGGKFPTSPNDPLTDLSDTTVGFDVVGVAMTAAVGASGNVLLVIEQSRNADQMHELLAVVLGPDGSALQNKVLAAADDSSFGRAAIVATDSGWQVAYASAQVSGDDIAYDTIHLANVDDQANVDASHDPAKTLDSGSISGNLVVVPTADAPSTVYFTTENGSDVSVQSVAACP